jgi:hypothetical protein
MYGRYPCRLIDPFTGEVTALPDLPIPLSEETPMQVARDEPEPPRFRLSTEDGFAWDWSPRGVMVARGDTAFFCGTGGGEWTPVHRSRHGSSMTINYRAGFFFVLDLGTLRTAVFDSETLGRSTEIDPPPRLGDITWALLVASTDDVLLLVRRRSRNRVLRRRRDIFPDVPRAAQGAVAGHGYQMGASDGHRRPCGVRRLRARLHRPRRRRRYEELRV